MHINREQILNTLQTHSGALKRFSVIKIGLFGSFAHNAGTAQSDIDFLVEMEHNTFDNYFGLKEFLEALFRRPVDLVIHDSVKPQLRHAIYAEAVYAEKL